MCVLPGLALDLSSNVVKFPVVRRTIVRSVLLGEPGKIRKYGRDEVAMMGVVRSQPRGV
jgi:hypothetical protein